MNGSVKQELEHRLALWQKLVETGESREVRPQRVRELGIYGGAQGIWVDKDRTQHITPHQIGVTVGLLHTGTSYADDLSDDGVIYHYPDTGRPPARDLAEVESTKMAKTLGLPVFVITPGRISALRAVHLAWIEDWDDRAKWFLISFGVNPPRAKTPELNRQDEPFFLTGESSPRKGSRDVREGQQRFKFRVFKRYGPACAVCGLDVPEVLDAAHLCPKEHKGSDDPRNGLVLCAVHHRALDAGLFAIDPETTLLHFRPIGPTNDTLRIISPSLNHLPQQPHADALGWRWKNCDFRPDTTTPVL